MLKVILEVAADGRENAVGVSNRCRRAEIDEGSRIDTDRVEGRDPPLAVGDIEDDGCRDGRHEPGILLDLDFELARVPARVSQDQRETPRAFSRNECREGFSAPGDGQTFRKNQVIVLQRAVPGFGKHETMARLDRTTSEDPGKLGGWGIEPQLFEDVREIHIDGTVDDQTESAAVEGMGAQENHRMAEIGITQRGHRDEEFADERIHAFMLAEGRAALDTGWGAGRSIAGLTAKAQRAQSHRVWEWVKRVLRVL